MSWRSLFDGMWWSWGMGKGAWEHALVPLSILRLQWIFVRELNKLRFTMGPTFHTRDSPQTCTIFFMVLNHCPRTLGHAPSAACQPTHPPVAPPIRLPPSWQEGCTPRRHPHACPSDRTHPVPPPLLITPRCCQEKPIIMALWLSTHWQGPRSNATYAFHLGF